MVRIRRTKPAETRQHAFDWVWLGVDRNLGSRWRRYLVQSAMATVSLIIIFLLEDAVLRAAIVVAVASTAFIIFVIPNSVAAEPKRIIGGHFMAVVTGVICWWVLTSFGLAYTGDNPRIYIDLAAAISVGLALLLMVSTNTEHPPAAGTALGLVIHGVTWDSVAFILASAIVFSIIRTALRSRLINLL